MIETGEGDGSQVSAQAKIQLKKAIKSHQQPAQKVAPPKKKTATLALAIRDGATGLLKKHLIRQVAF